MSESRAIHQLVHTLSYGDAISTEVLALQRTLQALGYQSEIFAIGEHVRLKGRSRPYREVLQSESADLILHYSLGSPLNEVYASWNRGRRTLVYHNITPAKWFEGVNARVSRDIERGLSDLPALCAASDAIWADSQFNADELAALGFRSEVLELLVDPGRWGLPRNETVYADVRRLARMNILHVGRLAPNKRVEDILKAFRFLHVGLEPDSKLWLVGIDTDTELYSFSLREMAARLGIGGAVEFTGCLSDEGVRALYEACDAYICMSEHEGFCLPLVEAMHFGLPLVAFGAGAVADTVGDGGVVVSEKRHAQLGQLLYDMAIPGELREKLVAHGRRRVAHFSEERFRARVADLVSRQHEARKAQGA
mgnify:CR=1 FL=1